MESRISGSIIFFAGFVLGIFICCLAWLWHLVPEPESMIKINEGPVAQPKVEADDEMRYDFYEIFPKSVVPIVEEYGKTDDKVIVDQFSWALQAGSFKSPTEANQMRAELILLGLNAKIVTAEVAEQKQHRVIVGPFDNELQRNRAQDKLAQAQITSLPIKVPR